MHQVKITDLDLPKSLVDEIKIDFNEGTYKDALLIIHASAHFFFLYIIQNTNQSSEKLKITENKQKQNIVEKKNRQ